MGDTGVIKHDMGDLNCIYNRILVINLERLVFLGINEQTEC